MVAREDNWVRLTPNGSDAPSVERARAIVDLLREEARSKYEEVEVQEGMQKGLEPLTWIVMKIGEGALTTLGAYLAKRLIQVVERSGGKVGATVQIDSTKESFDLPDQKKNLQEFYKGRNIDLTA